jgi:hypothetical protein
LGIKGEPMATFLAHGAVAGATVALSGALGEVRPRWNIAASLLAFVAGTIPDTLDWVLAITGHIQRWELYSWFHHSWLSVSAWYKVLLWPITAHVIMDFPFHKVPGENWWPRLWYLEVGMWLYAALCIYMAWSSYRIISFLGED